MCPGDPGDGLDGSKGVGLSASAHQRPEVSTPPSDGLVGDDDASLGEEILRIAEAQREAVIQLDGVTDDLGRESIAVIAERLAGHPPTLPLTGSS